MFSNMVSFFQVQKIFCSILTMFGPMNPYILILRLFHFKMTPIFFLYYIQLFCICNVGVVFIDPTGSIIIILGRCSLSFLSFDYIIDCLIIVRACMSILTMPRHYDYPLNLFHLQQSTLGFSL